MNEAGTMHPLGFGLGFCLILWQNRKAGESLPDFIVMSTCLELYMLIPSNKN
jgi:hypothetical protein